MLLFYYTLVTKFSQTLYEIHTDAHLWCCLVIIHLWQGLFDWLTFDRTERARLNENGSTGQYYAKAVKSRLRVSCAVWSKCQQTDMDIYTFCQ